MTRRKRQFLEDDDSSEGSEGSGDDFDGENEGEFRSGFKKRKRGGEGHIYGVFGSEDEEEDVGKRRKRRDLTKWVIQICFRYETDWNEQSTVFCWW